MPEIIGSLVHWRDLEHFTKDGRWDAVPDDGLAGEGSGAEGVWGEDQMPGM